MVAEDPSDEPPTIRDVVRRGHLCTREIATLSIERGRAELQGMVVGHSFRNNNAQSKNNKVHYIAYSARPEQARINQRHCGPAVSCTAETVLYSTALSGAGE